MATEIQTNQQGHVAKNPFPPPSQGGQKQGNTTAIASRQEIAQ